MADISISKSRGKKYLGGASPMVPAFIVGDDPIPLNPPGTIPTTLYKLLGDVTDSSFVGKNGFIPVVVGENVLTLQSLTTNVLATPLTGYVVGANTAITASNTILTAFQQVQGQINARVSGTIASGQVAFGTGVNTVGGSNNIFWDNTNGRLGIGITTPISLLSLGSSISNTKLALFDNGTNIYGFGVQSLQFRFHTDGAINSRFSFLNGSAGTEVFTIRGTTARVGINNLNPDTNLHVTSSGTVSEFRINNTSGTNVTANFGTTSAGVTFLGSVSNHAIFFQTNSVERARFLATGEFGVNTTSPTNTLDVNGTARIRTIANGVGDFLTKSATGVITSRTASETLIDIGAIGGNGVTGRVPYFNGTNTVTSTSNFQWNNTLTRLIVGSSSTSPFGDAKIFMGTDQNAETNFQISNSTNGTSASVGFRIFGQGGRSSSIREFSSSHSFTELASKLVIDVNNADPNQHGMAIILSGTAASSRFEIYTGGTNSSNKKFTLFNNGNLLIQSGGTHTDGGFKLDINGTFRSNGNFTLSDANNIILGTTTGTKIGTATTEKIGFWNKTPIIQPTTAYASSVLSSLGGTTITDTDTFDGYTLKQIVAALRGIGLLA